jgi:chemotaxis protein methyltransferase CheR
MTPADFEFLRGLLKRRSGLVLSADKQYLLESRLLPVARRAGFDSLTRLISALKADKQELLVIAVVEAMTTNESFFFRDKVPFDNFRTTVLPALLTARRHSHSLRIWCTAAASGQEPYSLAMALSEMDGRFAGWQIEVIATDISNSILEKARQGLYSQFEVQRGLPIQLLIKYFSHDGEMWQITPEIRAMVKYRQLNLLSDFSDLGTFDLIFCRNVLIYFDQETKVDVLDRLREVIADDGYLVLGAAETVVGLTDSFKVYPQSRGLYMPNPQRSKSDLTVGNPLRPRLVAVNGGR